MDICTLNDLLIAFTSSEIHFATLRNIDADIRTLCRNTHFAECQAIVGGKKAIIFAPITPQAQSIMLNAMRTLGRCNSEDIIPAKILFNELTTNNNSHNKCSIIVEYIGNKRSLEEALYTDNRTSLLRGLNDFRERLLRNDISHNNLNTHNILVDDSGRWWFIRGCYATTGYGGDCDSLRNIEQLIYDLAPNSIDHNQEEVCETEQPYHYASTKRFALCECRRRFQTEQGFGFEDDTEEVVIPNRYGYAYDFREGRAKVVAHDLKEGLIDKDGNELIPPIYDEVRYDERSGNSMVRLNNSWTLFDYQGIQINDWQDED